MSTTTPGTGRREVSRRTTGPVETNVYESDGPHVPCHGPVPTVPSSEGRRAGGTGTPVVVTLSGKCREDTPVLDPSATPEPIFITSVL